MFMAAEFMHFFTASLLTAVIFLGGWWGPGVEQVPVLGFIYLGLKTGVVYLFGLLIRATVPRVRIDQLMSLNWKWLVPISVGNVLMTAFLLKLVAALNLAPQSNDLIANIPQTVILLLGNLLIAGWVLNILRNRGRKERMAEATETAAPVVETHGHDVVHAGAPGH
jgi:NADH-quinone oxidoreductase subunit H